MTYQLYVPITGTFRDDGAKEPKPVEVSAEALVVYREEIHRRMLNVMQDGPDEEFCNPFEGDAKLEHAVERLRMDAVIKDGKLQGLIQVPVDGRMTESKAYKLEEFIGKEFTNGMGQIFPPAKVPGGWIHFQLQEPDSYVFSLQKKYEITDIAHPKYPWLHRIRSLVEIDRSIPEGTLGGFIQCEGNLSQEGRCWVCDQAICCEDAEVEKDARLFDGAMARESALVTGDACLYDRAVAEGHCCIRSGEIKENARVAGDAVINESSIDGLSPLIAGQCSVYGEVRGRFVIKDNVLPGESLVNPTEDLFVLEHGRKAVLVKQRALKPPQNYRTHTVNLEQNEKNQPER